MKSFKSRQVWKTPKIDIARIRIRYRVTEALVSSLKHFLQIFQNIEFT